VELTNGNRISLGSNKPRQQLESFKIRQPFFGGSVYHQSAEEDEDHIAHLKAMKESSQSKDKVVKRLGFAPSSDDHISYDSSLDQDQSGKVRQKTEITKAVPHLVYQEDIVLKKTHFDSLQQESLKANPMNTYNYDSQPASVAMSRAEFKSRKESNDVQNIPSTFTHSKARPSNEAFEESSKYFIKKNIQPLKQGYDFSQV
jgi:hypothetical protein